MGLLSGGQRSRVGFCVATWVGGVSGVPRPPYRAPHRVRAPDRLCAPNISTGVVSCSLCNVASVSLVRLEARWQALPASRVYSSLRHWASS